MTIPKILTVDRRPGKHWQWVDIVQQMGADRLIVVDVGAPLASDEQLNSPIGITMQMLDVLMKQRTAQVLSAMAPEDIKILPQLGTLSSADFIRSPEAIPLGAAAAEAQIERLRALSVSPEEFAAWRPRHRQPGFDPPLVAFLDVLKNRSWRPFQLAFLLLSIPSLADPTHPDRVQPVEAYADLLWFPTGGGKPEAYLGVAAFTMAIRRLQGKLGGLSGQAGVTVLMRYTLRLLTLQQFQRATTLIAACEIIRQEDLQQLRWQ